MNATRRAASALLELQPLADGWRLEGGEPVEQLGRLVRHAQDRAGLRAQKALGDPVVEQSGQVVVVAAHVEHAARLVVDPELAPRRRRRLSSSLATLRACQIALWPIGACVE